MLKLNLSMYLRIVLVYFTLIIVWELSILLQTMTMLMPNWPLSITAATRGSELEFDAVSQSNTPCGKSILLKCKIMLVLPQTSFDAQAFLKEAKANIDKGRKVGAQVKRIVPQNFEDFKSSSKYIVAPSGEIIGKHDLEPYRLRWL